MDTNKCVYFYFTLSINIFAENSLNCIIEIILYSTMIFFTVPLLISLVGVYQISRIFFSIIVIRNALIYILDELLYLFNHSI